MRGSSYQDMTNRSVLFINTELLRGIGGQVSLGMWSL